MSQLMMLKTAANLSIAIVAENVGIIIMMKLMLKSAAIQTKTKT